MKEFFTRVTEKIKSLISRLTRLFIFPMLFVSRKIFLPGFKGASLYDVGLFFVRGMKESSISLRANAISYSFIIAFVPAVLFLFTLIPYIPVKGLEENILKTLQEVIPNQAFLLLQSTIEDIITRQQTGLLSISFIISLYFASNGINAIMNAFNQSGHAIESRTFIKKQLIAFLLAFILAFNMIVAGTALALSSVLLYFMQAEGIISSHYTVLLLRGGRWLVILLTSIIAFSSIYYLAPAKKRVFPFFSAGSFLASFLSVVSFNVFTLFINNFSNYNKFYGSLGSMIMIIVWINLTALVLLIGYELNASIYEAIKSVPDDEKRHK